VVGSDFRFSLFTPPSLKIDVTCELLGSTFYTFLSLFNQEMPLPQDDTLPVDAGASSSNTVNGAETEELIAKIQNLGGQGAEYEDEDEEDNDEGEEKEDVTAEGGDGNADKKKKKKKKKSKTSKAVDRLK
jgi:uncharacterized membrane protein YukC